MIESLLYYWDNKIYLLVLDRIGPAFPSGATVMKTVPH